MCSLGVDLALRRKMSSCPVTGLERLCLCVLYLYQTEGCAVMMDLTVGEDRCEIWPCEDETLCERVHEKTSCGELGCEDMSFPCAAVVDQDRANSGLEKSFPRWEDRR